MFREGLRPPDPFRDRPPFETLRTQDGMTLHTLSAMSDVLVVCLPASPGPWLRKLSEQRRDIETAGLRVVIVFASEPGSLREHDLEYVARIVDAAHALYDAFELNEAAPGLWGRIQGRGPARQPGLFRLREGEIVRALRPERDRPPPDFLAALA